MKFQPIWRCWSCGAKLPHGERLDCEDCDRMLDQANTDLEMRLRVKLWIDFIPKINAQIDAAYAAHREQGVIAELRRELEGIAL